jgi:hypothetical protein
MSRVPGDSPAAELRPDGDAHPDTAGAPGHLRDRLERLPPGHPSSPYEADGTRRQPTPHLRELDTGPVDEDAFADDPDVADRSPSDGPSGVSPGTVGDATPDARPEVTYRFTEEEWADHRTETARTGSRDRRPFAYGGF